MVDICKSLLKDPMLEDAIRAGDCLAMLVEHYHGIGRMQDAYEHLRDMESRSIALHPYVNAQILEEVFRAVGVEEGRNGPRAGKNMDNHISEDGRSEEKQGSSSSDKAALKNKNSSHSHSSAADDGDIDSDIEEDIGDSPDPSSSSSSSRRGGEFKPQPQQTGHRGAPSGTGNSRRAVEKDRGERSSGTKKESARREDDEEQDALDEDIEEVK